MVQWTDVEVDFGDDETACFGAAKEERSNASSFQLKTLATVGAAAPSEQSLSETLCLEATRCGGVSDGANLAVVVDSDLSVFAMEPFELRFSMCFEFPPAAFCWLPACCGVLVVAAPAGRLVFLGASNGETVFSLKVPVEEDLIALSARLFGDECILAVASSHSFFLFRWPNFPLNFDLGCQPKRSIRELASSVAEEIACVEAVSDFDVDADVLLLVRCGSNTTIYRHAIQASRGGLYTVPLDSYSSGHASTLLLPASVDDDGAIESDSTEPLDSFVRSRLCADGRYAVCLERSGGVVVVDVRACVRVSALADAAARDLTVASPAADVRLSAVRLALLCADKDGGASVQVRCLPRFSLVYSVAASPTSALVRPPPSDASHMLFLEHVHCDEHDFGAFRICSLIEAQPEMRLKKLLKRRLFAEAELFAQQMGFDLQLIYTTQLALLSDELRLGRHSQADVDAFLKCADQVSDPAVAAAACVDTAVCLRRLSAVAALLSCGARRLQSAKDDAAARVREKLAAVDQRLHSFGVLRGQEADWPAFVAADSLLPHFESLLRDADWRTAGALWSRDEFALRADLADSNGWNGVLDSLLDQPLGERDAQLSLLRDFLAPAALLDAPEDCGALLADGLARFCGVLELSDFDGWPSNALLFARVVEDVARRWFDARGQHAALSPEQQARAAAAASTLNVDSVDAATPMGRLNVLKRDCRRIAHLADTYGCKLSLATFRRQTTESICYRLLDKELNPDALQKAIEKLAKAYTRENKLNLDQTLLNYVKDMLGAGSRCGAMLEERSLAVIGSIESAALRCDTVVELARYAAVPWSPAVAQLVDAFAGTTYPGAPQLLLQKRLISLRRLFGKYLIAKTLISSLSRRRHAFTSVAQCILQCESVPLQERLADALEVARFCDIATDTHVYSVAVDYFLCADQLSSALSLLRSLPPADSELVCRRHVHKLRTQLAESPLDYDRRLEAVAALSQRCATACEGGRARRMLQLHAHFGLVFRWSHVDDDAHLRQVFGAVVGQLASEEQVVARVALLGSLLGLDPAWVQCRAAAVCLLASAPVNAFKLLRTIKSVDKATDSIVESFMEVCDAFIKVLPGFDAEIALQLSISLAEVSLAMFHCACNGHVLHLPRVVAFYHVCVLVLRRCSASSNASVVAPFVFCPKMAEYDLRAEGFSIAAADVCPLLAEFGRVQLSPLPATPLCPQLLDHLRMNELHFLEFICRAAGLAHSGDLAQPSGVVALSANAKRAIGSLLAQSAVDEVLCLTLAFTLPSRDAVDLFATARRRLDGQPSRALVSLARVAAALAAANDDECLLAGVCALFRQAVWVRRLRAVGVGAVTPNALTGDSALDVVTEIAKTSAASLHTIAEFIKAFGCDESDALLRFVACLLELSLDDQTSSFNFNRAEEALGMLVGLPVSDLVNRLLAILPDVDPYNYEAIDLLLRYASVSDEAATSECVRLSRLTSFLHCYKRTSAPLPQEAAVYSERGLRDLDAAPAPDETAFELPSGESSRRQAPTALPDEAKTRLPLHVFLVDGADDMRELLLPLVEAEVSVANIGVWLDFAGRVCPARLSQSQLLSFATLKAGKQLKASAAELVDPDRELLRLVAGVVNDWPDQQVAIQCLGVMVKHLPTCEAKLKLLQIGLDVATEWAKKVESADAVKQATHFVDGFRNALKRVGTEFILRQAALLNEMTAALIASPARLIFHLYENLQPMSDGSESAHKAIGKIAELNQIHLSRIHQNLIEKWLQLTKPSAELDTTIGEMSEPPSSASDIVVTPFFDDDVSRALMLFRLKETRQAAFQLTSMINQQGGALAAKMRAFCCLLRVLTPSQIHATLSLSLDDLRCKFAALLYTDQLGAVKLAFSIKAFVESDKSQLARSLWQKRAQFGASAYPLLAALCIDYDVGAEVDVAQILEQLMQRSQVDLCVQLLLRCQQGTGFWTLSNLQKCWLAACERLLEAAPASDASAEWQVCCFIVRYGVCSARIRLRRVRLRCPALNESAAGAMQRRFERRNTTASAACVALLGHVQTSRDGCNGF